MRKKAGPYFSSHIRRNVETAHRVCGQANGAQTACAIRHHLRFTLGRVDGRIGVDNVNCCIGRSRTDRLSSREWRIDNLVTKWSVCRISKIYNQPKRHTIAYECPFLIRVSKARSRGIVKFDTERGTVREDGDG